MWIQQYHEADQDAPLLVCLPHAGGAAPYFYPLSAALAPATQVLAVQYPGRQNRFTEAPLTSIEALRDEICEVLADRFGPSLSLLGHSMGATLAFEVARRLEARTGSSLGGLILSGRTGPPDYPDAQVRLRDDAGVIEEIRELGGTDAELLTDETVRAMILPAVRADYTAIELYRFAAGPRLRCPIRVYRGDADPRVDAAGAARWADQTEADCGVRTFPGGHFFLGDQWPDVARAVTADLAAFAQAGQRQRLRGRVRTRDRVRAVDGPA